MLYGHRKIRKCTDTDVAFTREYSKVSISSGNEKYSSPKLICLGESADKRMTTKRREMNDRRVERALDTGTSGLSNYQATKILFALVLIGGCSLQLWKGMRREPLRTTLFCCLQD
jgi:hypothetical protein